MAFSGSDIPNGIIIQCITLTGIHTYDNTFETVFIYILHGIPYWPLILSNRAYSRLSMPLNDDITLSQYICWYHCHRALLSTQMMYCDCTATAAMLLRLHRYCSHVTATALLLQPCYCNCTATALNLIVVIATALQLQAMYVPWRSPSAVFSKYSHLVTSLCTSLILYLFNLYTNIFF